MRKAGNPPLRALPARARVLAPVIILAAVVVAVSIFPPLVSVPPRFMPSAVVIPAIVLVIIPAVSGWQRLIVTGPTTADCPYMVRERWRQTRRQQCRECDGGGKQEDFPGKMPDWSFHTPMHRAPEERQVYESAIKAPARRTTPRMADGGDIPRHRRSTGPLLHFPDDKKHNERTGHGEQKARRMECFALLRPRK